MNVVPDFDFRDSLPGHQNVRRRGIGSAGMRTAIGGAGGTGSNSWPRFNQLLPCP